MMNLAHKFLILLKQQIQKRLIWGLTLFFLIGTIGMLWNLSQLSTEFIKSTAIHDARTYSEAIAEFRNYYTSQVVNRVKTHGITVTHDYQSQEAAIPLPATLSIELGHNITANSAGVQVRLYSDYPFPWRKDGGPHDDFEQTALTYLRANPKSNYIRFETIQGRYSLRYATANILQEGCVACHNSHPDSPKTDWQVGDVRGVLEVVRPVDNIFEGIQNNLKGTFLVTIIMSLVGLGGLGLAMHRLHDNALDLTRYAQNLETEMSRRQESEQERIRLAAIEQELLFAREIQQGLLPKNHEHWHELDIVSHSKPAHEVGGDLYAYRSFMRGIVQDTPPPQESSAERKYSLAVGDVSGKGMPAALLMAVSLASFQLAVERPFSPKELLAYLDHAIVPYTKTSGSNCALCYIELQKHQHPTTQSEAWLLKVANAGCIPPYIKRNNGTVEWLDIGGIPLGVGLGAEHGYNEMSILLNKGDMVILTSDGVAEAKNLQHEMFGFERLEAAITHGPSDTPQHLLDYLLAQTAAFVGPAQPHDDLTIVIIRV